MRIRMLLFVLVIALGAFSGGYLTAKGGYGINANGLSDIKIDKSVPNDKNVDFALFWRVWETLETSYFDKTKLNATNMVYGAISGMVSAVGDPYTVFLPPSENKVVQEDLKGSFQGVGIQIGFRGTQLAVVAPLPETPAEEAGIRAGDFIIGIKDEAKGIDLNTSGMSLPDAVELIRGPEGSKVTLALLRDGTEEPLIVDVTRREINVPSVMVSYVGDSENIAHVRLLKFAGETNGEWETVVRDLLKKSGLKGIVFDLRNNPGGYLQGAVDIAGEFTPNGTLIVIEEKASGAKTEFKTDRIPRLKNIPTVLLVNKGSASASEILAGALRDQAKMKILGTTTFGKGIIQEPQQFENGAGLHITTARWLTPSGYWVNEKGLEPDLVIDDNVDTEDDEQLNKALEEFGV